MKISLPSWAKMYFVRVLSLLILTSIIGALSSAEAATTPPVLISDAVSTRAVAFESVTMRPEPIKVTASANFNLLDKRTRVVLFAMNLNLLPGETANGNATSFTADAEDAAHTHYPMNVEYVDQVPGFPGIYMIVLRLNDGMTNSMGDVLMSLSLHTVSSNRVRVAIGVTGGGPADDPGAVPTPAPATPPGPNAPVTMAEYQALYNNPALAAGPDGLRFLEQTTWGPTDADLTHLRSVGMLPYLNEQFNTPPLFASVQSNYPATPLYPASYPASPPAAPCDSSTTCFRDNYTLYPLQKQFMTNALTQPDQLRQRVAFALHKVLVVGGVQLNLNETSWYAPYLQTIDRNAFGNFRALLFEITLNPGMGEYLNMRGNSVGSQPPAPPTPNENYAREIMQLFSIGVDTLNQDGTPVLDAQGDRVPSYDQAAISNLARVFTGWDLAAAKVWSVDGVTSVTNYLDPMVPSSNRNRYDIGQKTLLTDINHPSPVIVPACGNCTGNTANTQAYAIASLNTAIDNLFNHPNTGPYICGQLIHQLVTSNPSPPYVGRCAAVFANNGSGTRGDMKAVITEILLDPEARGDVKNDPNYGHLREPLLLMTHLLRAFNATSDGVLATSNAPNNYANDMGQNLFNPPTVFSYFPADYGLPGASLFGPEFGLLDTSLTYRRANFMNTLFLANNGTGIPANPANNRPTGTQLNLSSYQAMSTNPTNLVDTLNAKLMHGTMSQAMRTNIIATVTAITNASATTQALQRTQAAIYLIATSAQYQVER